VGYASRVLCILMHVFIPTSLSRNLFVYLHLESCLCEASKAFFISISNSISRHVSNYISIPVSVPIYISSHISVRRRGCFVSCVISFFLHLYTYVSISIHMSIHVSVRHPGCSPTPSLYPFLVLSNYIPIPISVSVSQIVSLVGVGGVVYLESCLYFCISTSTFQVYTYTCISIDISIHVSVRRRWYYLS